MLETQWLSTSDLQDPDFRVDGDRVVPRIQLTSGQIARIVDEAEDALLTAELGLYQLLWLRFRVKGRTSFGQRPCSAALATRGGRYQPSDFDP